MRARRTAVVLVSAVLVLVGTACGSDDDDDASTATTAGPPATTDDTASTTTTAADTTTTAAGGALGDEPPFHDDGPSGSGCTPGDDDRLPDGWWYGDLVVPPGVGLAFDLACYYVGAAAEAEAASRGDEVTNDYYVVDDNPADRDITIARGATASCVDLGSTMQMVDCTPPDVAGDWNVWVRVVDGEVGRMVEQYAP